MGSIPGSGTSPGVGIGSPLQYSCLEQKSLGGGHKESDTTERMNVRTVYGGKRLTDIENWGKERVLGRDSLGWTCILCYI